MLYYYALILKALLMPTETIVLQVDAEVAQMFRGTSRSNQEKLQALLGVWLREYTKANAASLNEVMNKIGENAQNRGLTPEIMEGARH